MLPHCLEPWHRACDLFGVMIQTVWLIEREGSKVTNWKWTIQEMGMESVKQLGRDLIHTPLGLLALMVAVIMPAPLGVPTVLWVANQARRRKRL